MGILKVTRISKPLVISAVIFLFIGSGLGALLMMNLFGFNLSVPIDLLRLHRTIQIEGFLTLLIMGIGYMLIPRFRNIDDPKWYQVYIPFSLVLASIIMDIFSMELATTLMLSGVIIFLVYMLNATRIRPKLLPLSDYYIILAVVSLLLINLIRFFEPPLTLQYIQLWLLFPLFMILGVEYKTLPSFIGYVNPKDIYTRLSFILGVLSILLGLFSIIEDSIAIFFSITLLATMVIFDKAVYATHGFDYSHILEYIKGEVLIRYKFTLLHIRLAYLFLYSSLVASMLYYLINSFALYDLAIHLMTIGFIGLTIKLYLPMMLPPILGRSISFAKFNLIPLYLILSALGIRTIGMLILSINVLSSNSVFMQVIGVSGWLIVIALFLYVNMIHKSMRVKI